MSYSIIFHYYSIHLSVRDVYKRQGLPYPYSQEDANVFLSMVQAKENIQDFCIEVNGEAVGSIGFVPATDAVSYTHLPISANPIGSPSCIIRVAFN